MSAPRDTLNEMFSVQMDSADFKEKIAASGSDWIKDRLREECFVRSILPPKTVSRADLQVSVNHDTLVKIVEVEPESHAMTMTFRGQPSVVYITGTRFEVPFHEVASKRYEKTEQELMAYTMPITEIIKRNVVRDIQEIEDYTFLTHCESAVQALQRSANSLAFTGNVAANKAFTAYNVNSATTVEVGKVKAADVLAQAGTASGSANAGLTQNIVTSLQKDDLVKLFSLFPGNGSSASRLRCDRFVITETDFEDINSWTTSEVGDKIVGETTVDGFKYSTLLGRKYIKTIKTDILRPGNIYAFAAPDFLGGFFIFNKTKFYADKVRNRVSWEAWEDIGMYIANAAAVRKLELYAGAVETVTGQSSVKATYAPVSESDLGKKNNLVDEGQTFPSVSGF